MYDIIQYYVKWVFINEWFYSTIFVQFTMLRRGEIQVPLFYLQDCFSSIKNTHICYRNNAFFRKIINTCIMFLFLLLLPNYSSEEGDYLALDLGGTNFRVLLCRMKNGKCESLSRNYNVPTNKLHGPAQGVCMNYS